MFILIKTGFVVHVKQGSMLELLHMDLFESVAYLSIRGSKYGLVIVDGFSCFTWVFFLQDKLETQSTLKCFLRRAQNEFELKVKKIRSDNGYEFKNIQVEEYLEEEGIKHEFSAPYMPQQNGVVRGGNGSRSKCFFTKS
jgi:transposase InsO family protein